MPTVEELERLRRSIAMLSPGASSGLSREDAISLLAELKTTQRELARLVTGLRALLEPA